MKLTLRPEWRPRALSSLIGFIELKTGVRIAILFAMLNKVAGIYGLITVFTGGNLAQLSMYTYSVVGLAAYVWGLKAVKEEDPSKSLITAHFFLVDHVLNTIWLTVFAVDWWLFNPHDGVRVVNSQAQQEVIEVGPGHGIPMTPEERLEAAQGIWHKEKGLAGLILALGWFCKIYFALLLYSYALHLRKGTYRSLPLTVAATHRTAADDYGYDPVYETELEDGEAGYDFRRPNDRKRADRDIDFDVEFDDMDGGDDVERGRVRGRRAGASLSVGGANEFMAGPQKPTANGAPRRDQRVSSKPIVPPSTRSPPKPTPQPKDKGKSRAIQQELEQSGPVESWDDDDDTDTSRSVISRARTPVNGSTAEKR